MMSVANNNNDGGIVSPSERENGAVEAGNTIASTIGVGSTGDYEFSTVKPIAVAARIGVDGSDDTSICDNVNDSRVLKLESEGSRFSDAGGGENQHISPVSKRSGWRSGKQDNKKNRSAVEDYDCIVSAFDEFGAGKKDQAVGDGLRVGDMVWGKVKSHPWWPGFIHNEAFASHSVRRGKNQGNVLVAFFGDGSYGWFDPAELIPFEENFVEKSKQTISKSFLKAVDEAADELSRRSSLGLACRCRNEFNFWPSSVERHFIVDVGDCEPVVYGLSQISKARDSFQTREMFSFIMLMALEPNNDQHGTVDFFKNKATALAYRKATFEEFDDTYAQAFGTVPVRPPRLTAPVAVDPSKVRLSGPLVVAETLGKGKVSVEPAKTKDQVEKDKYLFKRREESLQPKSKKASSLHADHMHQASESGATDSHHQPISNDNKPSEGSSKLSNAGTKKGKVPKRSAGDIISESTIAVKKKKKKTGMMSTEIGMKPRELPPHVHLINDSGLGNQKTEGAVSSSSLSSQSQQEVDFEKIELQMLVRDLCALALNPFHGEQKSCPAVIKQVFMKFRSLVYQKGLVLVPPADSKAVEDNSSRLPAPTVSVCPADKTNDKIVRPSARLDDPTIRGKKHDLSNRPEDVKKRKLGALQGVKRKKVDHSLDGKKKIGNSNFLIAERKIHQRPAEPLRGNAPPSVPKAVKLEHSKRTEPMARSRSPTMLVMKFPAGANLPSGFQLKAKFARYGPLDQSATRIFWKTHTCRLVFLRKADAQEALESAVGSSTLFGNTDVRCFLRDMEVEKAESEPVKVQKEAVSAGPPQSRDTAIEQKIAPKSASKHRESSVQLKSCLKKPSGDEEGNGGGRVARVKFVLGGEESRKNNIASFAHGAATSKHSLDLTSKILTTKFNPQLTSAFQKFPVSMPSTTSSSSSTYSSFEKGSGALNVPLAPEMTDTMPMNNGIAQQMLNLLKRCDEVVNNLRGALGYMPYHPL